MQEQRKTAVSKPKEGIFQNIFAFIQREVYISAW